MVCLKDNGDKKRTMGNDKTVMKDNGILFYFSKIASERRTS
jgi:hypothetical protein